MNLTVNKQQCLDLENGKAIRLVEPETQREYVVLTAEEYERLTRLMQAELVDPSLYEFEEIDEA